MTNKEIRPMKEPWKLMNYWKREAVCILLVTISGILYNVGMLVGPVVQGKMLDALLQKSDKQKVMLLAFVFVCSTFLVQAFRYMKRFYIRRFANETSATMRFMIYNNIIHKEERELKQENLGSLMTKAISDVEACVEGMRKFTTEVFDTGVLLASYLVTLFVYDFKVTLVSCIFIPVAMLIARNLKKMIYKYTFSYRKQLSEITAITYDYLDNSMLYRLYGREEDNQMEYEKQLSDLEKKAVKANVWENAMQPIYNVIAMAGVILVIALLGQRVMDGNLSIGVFSTYMTIFTAMAFKASKAAKLFNSVQKASVSWKRIKPFMEEFKSDDVDFILDTTKNKIPNRNEASNINEISNLNEAPNTNDVRNTKEDLKLTNVSFAYEDGNLQINHLDLTASVGQIIGITGPVACGKSTLGKLFLGNDKYSGSITIDGEELSNLTKNKRTQKIAYLGHEPQLLSDTICENITLSKKKDVSKVLSMVCFDKDLVSMEEGAQTRVGNGGVRLSGGQQARIALARTLYHKRRLMILDDPFSAVDKETEDTILRNMKEELSDCIVLLISHRLAQFDKVDKVLLMHVDKTYEIGTHEELLSKSKLYRQLYELQEGKGGEENE